MAGLASLKWEVRVIRLLGWLGILGFFVCLVAISIPGEDYTFGGPNGPTLNAPCHVNPAYITTRLFLLILIGSLLAWSFRNVRPSAVK